METFACLTSNSGLPQIEAEGGLIRHLFGFQAHIRDASPDAPSVEALIHALRQGGIGLFHLAGHGTFDPSLPNEAGFPLADGSVFRASDLHGAVQTQVSKDRPLVFLNACRSGRQAWSWTSLGGWVDRWVRVCGCGAFLGPQWNVKDSIAFAFAQVFYEALVRGETLGVAAKAAREAVRKAAPADPGWLAYAVYGLPNARIVFRQTTSGETSPAVSGMIKPETLKTLESTSGNDSTEEQVGFDGLENEQPSDNVIGFSTYIITPKAQIWQDYQAPPEVDSVLHQNISGCYSVTGDDSRDATLEHLFDDRYRLSKGYIIGAGIFRSGRYLGACREVTNKTWGIMHGVLRRKDGLAVYVAGTRDAVGQNDEIWSWKTPIARRPYENGLSRQYLINDNALNPILIIRMADGILTVETSYWSGIGLLHEGHYLGTYKYTSGVLATSWGNARWMGVWGCHEGDVSADGVFRVHGKNLIGMKGEFDITWNPAWDM